MAFISSAYFLDSLYSSLIQNAYKEDVGKKEEKSLSSKRILIRKRTFIVRFLKYLVYIIYFLGIPSYTRVQTVSFKLA